MDTPKNEQHQAQRLQGRSIEDILAELKASDGAKHYSPSARKRLFNEFIRYATADPIRVRALLERSPEYDDTSPDGEVIKNYAALPLLLVLQWVEKCPDWRNEPIICSQIADWLRSLPALRNYKHRTRYLDGLRQVDPDLVPSTEQGAGVYGVDQHLYEWQQRLLPVLEDLHDRYDDQRGSIHGSAVENRRRKIISLYRDLVDERGFWHGTLSRALGGPEKLNTQEVPSQAIEYLGTWLPDDTRTSTPAYNPAGPQRPTRRRPETVTAFCIRRLSDLFGLSQQTVKNALKRHRAKIRKDQ